MNTPALLISVVVLLSFLIAARWARKASLAPVEGETELYDASERTFFRWVMRGCLLAALVSVTVLVQASGLVDLSDPFQGQDARGLLPMQSAVPVAVGDAPQLDGVRVQPDVDAVAAEHQQQLDSFENK